MKNSKKTSKTTWQDTRANSLFINDPDIGVRWDNETGKMELCRGAYETQRLDSELFYNSRLPRTYNGFWRFFIELVRDYKLPVDLVHKCFLQIPEYREAVGSWSERQEYGDEVD